MAEEALAIIMTGYDDADAAKADYAALKKLNRQANITVDGMILISREPDGQITVKESGDDDDVVIGGTMVGVVGGFALGLFFPPLILVSTVVGGGLGALAGELVRKHHEKGIARDLEDVMPPNSSGVVAVVEARFSDRVQETLTRAERKAIKEADKADAKALKAALAEAEKQAGKRAAA